MDILLIDFCSILELDQIDAYTPKIISLINLAYLMERRKLSRAFSSSQRWVG